VSLRLDSRRWRFNPRIDGGLQSRWDTAIEKFGMIHRLPMHEG